MPENSKTYKIPAKHPKRDKRVGIYCSVSTNRETQLKRLKEEVSELTRLIADEPQWLLVDIYMDIASNKTGSYRREFNRMLEDCKSHKLDIILTRSSIRFGKNTDDAVNALNQLKILGVRVIFESEHMDTAMISSDIIIAVLKAVPDPEEKNKYKGYNIKTGIKTRAAMGISKLYNRKCYGYKNTAEGSLFVYSEEAKNVQLIYDLYLKGKSIIGIVKELERLCIESPTGRYKWSKRTIDVMLSNEKYTGSVILLNNGKNETVYLCKNNHPAIISNETFQAVQAEKTIRSNVIKDKNGAHRKTEKYSSKQ